MAGSPSGARRVDIVRRKADRAVVGLQASLKKLTSLLSKRA